MSRISGGLAGNPPLSARGEIRARLGRDEFQRDAVDAVAQPRGLAGRRRTHGRDGRRSGGNAPRPAPCRRCSRCLFRPRLRSAHRSSASRCRCRTWSWTRRAADRSRRRVKVPVALLIVQGAGEGTLGVLLAQHRILLGRQKLAPFLRRVGHLEGAGGRRAAAADQAISDRGRADGGDGKSAARPDLAPCEGHRSLLVVRAALPRPRQLVQAHWFSSR